MGPWVPDMFGRRFSLIGSTRRTFALFGFLLALVGGVLAVAAALLGGGAGARVAWALLGVGAVFGAGRIYRGGVGWIFPRPRLLFGSVVTLLVGALMLAAGLGTAGLLTLVG